MIALQNKVNSIYLDLGEGFSFPISHINNVFDFGATMGGDKSYSFTIPDTPHNRSQFKFITRIDSIQSITEEYEYLMYVDNIYHHTITIGVTSCTEDKINLYALFGKSALYKLFETRLFDLPIRPWNLKYTDDFGYRCNGVYVGHRDLPDPGPPADAASFQVSLIFYAPSPTPPVTVSRTVVRRKSDQSQDMCVVLSNAFNLAKVSTTWLNNFELIFDSLYVGAGKYIFFVAAKSITQGYSYEMVTSTHPFMYMNFPGSDWEFLLAQNIYTQNVAAYMANFITKDGTMPFAFLPVRNDTFDSDQSYRGVDDDYNAPNPSRYRGTRVMNAYLKDKLDMNQWDHGGIKHFAIVPMFSYAYILNLVFDWIEENSPFTINRMLPDLAEYYIYNTTALDYRTDWNTGFHGDVQRQTNSYRTEIQTRFHLPDISISELLNEFKKLFCCRVYVNTSTNEVKFIPIKDVLAIETPTNLTQVTELVEIESEEFKSTGIRLICDSQDAACQDSDYELQYDEVMVSLDGTSTNYDLEVGQIPSTVKNAVIVYQNIKLYHQRITEYFQLATSPFISVRTLSFLGYVFKRNKYPVDVDNYIDIKIGTLNQPKYETCVGFKQGSNFDQIIKKFFLNIPESSKPGTFRNFTNATPQNYLTLIRKGNFNGAIIGSDVYESPRVYNIEPQVFYDQYWKQLLQFINGKKFKIKVQLSRNEYEKIQNEGIFRIANNNFIFKEMDINITNQSGQNLRYEAIITAYRLS